MASVDVFIRNSIRNGLKYLSLSLCISVFVYNCISSPEHIAIHLKSFIEGSNVSNFGCFSVIWLPLKGFRGIYSWGSKILLLVVRIDSALQLEKNVSAKSKYKILSFQLLKLMNKEIKLNFFLENLVSGQFQIMRKVSFFKKEKCSVIATKNRKSYLM